MRARTITFAALAVLGGFAVTPASVSAASCTKESSKTKFALCFGEPLELVEGKFGLHTNNDPTKPTKEFELFGPSVRIRCPEILLQLGATLTVGTRVALGLRVAGIVAHFVNCVVTEPRQCVVYQGLIISTTLDGVPPPAAENERILWLPEKGTRFTTLRIESSGGVCAVAGNQNVTSLEGKEEEGPLCGMPNVEATSVLHLVECPPENSNLKVGEEEVLFSGNASWLLEGQRTKWAIILGK